MTSTIAGGRAVPVLDLDPFADDVLEDPLEFEEALREAGPVVWLPKYGVYGMGRFDSVHAALTDWQRFESGAGVGMPNFRKVPPWRPPSLLLESDPPLHDAPRSTLSRVIGPRALRRVREAWTIEAEAMVDELLGDRTTIEIDLFPALCQAFPLRVFPGAVGLPVEGREHLLPYGNHAFNANGPENYLVLNGNAAMVGHAAWVNEQCRHEALADSGFGAEIWAAADHGEVTHDQAPLIIRSLLTAGVDTTVQGFASVLHGLSTNPDMWARVRAEPSLTRIAFEEAVRWQSPVHTYFRTSTVDIAVGDVVIPRHEKIQMFLGAANHDPRRWENGSRFDLDRDPSGHVGFGMGVHQCVGQHVARLEAEALLPALAARVERMEPLEPAGRLLNNTLRGYVSLPMRLTVA